VEWAGTLLVPSIPMGMNSFRTPRNLSLRACEKAEALPLHPEPPEVCGEFLPSVHDPAISQDMFYYVSVQGKNASGTLPRQRSRAP